MRNAGTTVAGGDRSGAVRRGCRALLHPAITVTLAVACLVQAGCATRQDAQSLRFMTYNIAAGGGNLEAIADVIREVSPDIVALQEVDVHWSARSGFADQAAALGSTLGMYVRFAAIYSLADSTAESADRRNSYDGAAMPREFGLAILSRAPIVEFANHVIPRLSTQRETGQPEPLPGFAEAVIDVGGVRLHVFNTHLDYRADPYVREQQVTAMLAVTSQRAGAVVLMGDLNARPDAPELQPLLAQFADAWAGHGSEGQTYPADTPDRRIDYVLLSDHFRVNDARVPVTVASDHRPVVIDVMLRGGMRQGPRKP